MLRDALISCLPYLAAIVVSVLVLRLLVYVSRAELKLPHLRCLHRDEAGGVQSLSFVLTLPIFMFFLMFIVQMSQLVIAQVVIHYSAFAATRSAIVWIPASSGNEQANEIGSSRTVIGSERGVNVYQVGDGTEKFERIRRTAAMACMSISPSRNVGVSGRGSGNDAVSSLQRAYLAIAPSSQNNGRVPTRIANKLAYALDNTQVEIRVRHKTLSPEIEFNDSNMYNKVTGVYGAPDSRYLLNPGYGPDYWEEFQFNEVGWHDQVEVKVVHNFALLPGPGRLLALLPNGQGGQGTLRSGYLRIGSAYAVPITATVRLQIEGQKSLLPYQQFGS